MSPRDAPFEFGRVALSRPCFASLAPEFRQALQRFGDFPRPADYDALVDTVACSLPRPRFVAWSRDAVERVGGYERHVQTRAEVPTRANSWHDLFNLAVWAHWPRTKWALNRIQCATLPAVDPANGRARAQNVAAHFDECGLVIEGSDPEVFLDLSEHRFKRVFWELRERLARTTRFWIVGHGSLEGLLAPHDGLLGKAVLVEGHPRGALQPSARAELDRIVAARIDTWVDDPSYLQPVPLLGIPGFREVERAEFYDDTRVFRPRPVYRPRSHGTNSAPSTSQA